MLPPIVVGAGICGLTAGAALRTEGYEPTIVDRAARPDDAEAGIIIGTNGVRLLERLGIADRILTAGQLLDTGRIVAADGRTLMQLSFSSFEGDHIGSAPISIDRVALVEALHSVLDPHSVEYGRTCTGTAHQARDEQVQFADGETIQTNLVVGADGVHSEVRRSLFHDTSIRASGWYSYRGIASESVEDHLRAEVWQIWGTKTRVRFAPIDAERVGWTILTEGTVGPEEEPGQLLAALSERCRGYPEPVRTLLARTRPGTVRVEPVLETPTLDRWHGEGIALAGDAAHATVPFLGTDLGLAMVDAFAIADGIRGADNIASGLAVYEADRKPTADWFAKRSRQLLSLSTLERPVLRGARNQFVRLTPEFATHRFRRRLASN